MTGVKLETTSNKRRLHIGSFFVDLNETDYQELIRIFTKEIPAPIPPKVSDDLEKMADDWYCKEYDFDTVRNTNDGLTILKKNRKPFIAGFKAAQSNDAEMIEFHLFCVNTLDDYHMEQPMYEEPDVETMLQLFKNRNNV